MKRFVITDKHDNVFVVETTDPTVVFNTTDSIRLIEKHEKTQELIERKEKREKEEKKKRK